MGENTADKEKISVGAERQRRYGAVRKLRTEPMEEHLWDVPDEVKEKMSHSENCKNKMRLVVRIMYKNMQEYAP